MKTLKADNQDRCPGTNGLRSGTFVIVIDPERPLDPPRHGRVTSIGQRWLHVVQVEADGTAHTAPASWRMDVQTQNEGRTSGFGGLRFVTPEQFRWERRATAAVEWLREQRIEVAFPSEWWERRVLLANLLRAVDGLEPF